jgi:hypothetical protein
MSDYTAPQFCPECDNPTSLCMCDFSPPKRDPRKENKMNNQKTFEELRDEAAMEAASKPHGYFNEVFSVGADWARKYTLDGIKNHKLFEDYEAKIAELESKLLQAQNGRDTAAKFMTAAVEERDLLKAQCEKLAAVILTAMQVLDIDRQDFDGLRVQKFKSFNVHELDTTFAELKEALAEYRKSVKS